MYLSASTLKSKAASGNPHLVICGFYVPEQLSVLAISQKRRKTGESVCKRIPLNSVLQHISPVLGSEYPHRAGSQRVSDPELEPRNASADQCGTSSRNTLVLRRGKS